MKKMLIFTMVGVPVPTPKMWKGRIWENGYHELYSAVKDISSLKSQLLRNILLLINTIALRLIFVRSVRWVFELVPVLVAMHPGLFSAYHSDEHYLLLVLSYFSFLFLTLILNHQHPTKKDIIYTYQLYHGFLWNTGGYSSNFLVFFLYSTSL